MPAEYIRKPVVFESQRELDRAIKQAKRRAKQAGHRLDSRRGWFSWYVRDLIEQDRFLIEQGE